MVLVGVHPSLTHVPPTCSRSRSDVRIPAAANACARGTPACPAPTTIASYCVLSIESSLRGKNRNRLMGLGLYGALPLYPLSRNRRFMNRPPRVIHEAVTVVSYKFPHSTPVPDERSRQWPRSQHRLPPPRRPHLQFMKSSQEVPARSACLFSASWPSAP